MNLRKHYLGKKALRKIVDGDHDALMEAIEFLIDSKGDNNYDEGYHSCIEDLEVYSFRLAEKIIKKAGDIGDRDEKGYYLMDDDELKKIIKEFFNDFKIEKDGRE